MIKKCEIGKFLIDRKAIIFFWQIRFIIYLQNKNKKNVFHDK
jgi:hypothetical protein